MKTKRALLCVILAALLTLSQLPVFAGEETLMLQDGAVYRFIHLDTGLTLSASSYGVSQNASVAQLEEWKRDLNQAWRAHSQPDGTWKFECLSSGWYLTVYRKLERPEPDSSCKPGEI